MIGRLLHTAANSLNPGYTRNTTVLESATEEEHTRSLLFPDASLLHHPTQQFYPLYATPTSPTSPVGGFDDRGGLEIDAGNDLRVLVAQDALGDQDEPCLLLDSRDAEKHVAPRLASPAQGRHRRAPSAGLSDQSPTSPTLFRPTPFSPAIPPTGAFQNSRMRSQTLPLQQDEDLNSIGFKDAKDDTRALLNCMFGSSALSYKGASTKMHVISAEPATNTNTTTGSPPDRSTTGAYRRRREPITRAHTYGVQAPIPRLSHARSGSNDSTPGKEAILLTRMFSVSLPEATDSAVEEPGTLSIPYGTDSAYPFPYMNGHNHDRLPKRKKLKEKKTPAYAVAIVVQPPTASNVVTRPSSGVGCQRTSKVNETVATSFGSDFQNSWTFLESPMRMPYSKGSQSEMLDQHIETVVEHWDIVTRALTSLEMLASKEILNALKDIDNAYQHALSPKPPKEKSMQRTNQRIIQLLPLALSGMQSLKDLANHTMKRLAQAIRIPRVVCGQNRWGPFLDEARWMSRWAGGKEQNLFFYNVLTAFLGNHTEWLAFLGPEWYKRRYLLQQKATQNFDPVVANRTVLLCPDKMPARRILFLLSSFLPPNLRSDALNSPLRPNTSVSTRQSSHSPPAGVGSFSRERSLRRTINKRAMTEQRLAAGLSTSASSNEGNEHLEIPYRGRKGSDTRSVRTFDLPIPTNDFSSRKSSAATTSTVTPNPTTPVPHFTAVLPRDENYFSQKLDGSSHESMASVTLREKLRRSHSALEGENIPAPNKWSNLLSGIWSGRQDSSSEHESSDSKNENVNGSLGRKQGKRAQSQLSKMVEEVSATDKTVLDHKVGPGSMSAQNHSAHVKKDEHAHESPNVSAAEASPVKLMVDEREGVVDVDISLPGFLSSSLDSPFRHAPAPVRHIPSLTSLDGVTSICSNTSTTNLSAQSGERSCLNVAGWLGRYHEDFVLQAVRPYDNLETEIRASMSRELTPTHALPASTPDELTTGTDHWVDVCSTLVADVRTWSMKRIRLRRRIHTRDLHTNGFQPEQSMSSALTPAVTASGAPPTLTCETLEEVFITESVMDLDDTLSDAVERVVAQGSHLSSRTDSSARVHNRTLSSTSKASTASTKDTLPPTLVYPPAECKRIIVGALEEIVRSVSEDLTKHEGGRDIGLCSANETMPSHHDSAYSRKVEDNALREGIRKWLLSVENMEGA